MLLYCYSILIYLAEVTKVKLGGLLTSLMLMVYLPDKKKVARFSSQSGVAQVLLLLFLIVGIGVGTILVQNRTSFLPHADDGYEGDRESEPDHGDTNVDSEKHETDSNDNGGGGNDSGGGGGGGSSDGNTFDNQSQETKDAFKAAHPEDPEGAWKAEHEQELKTRKTADGRDIVNGKPVEKDWDGDGDIDVEDAARQVQEARKNQAAISAALSERDKAKAEYDAIVANDNYDIVAATAARKRMEDAEKAISNFGSSYEEAEALTHAKEADFNKAVESATSSPSISDEDLGSVIGYIAVLFGESPEQAGQRAADAIASRDAFTSSSMGGAAGMAANSAGATPQESMQASANAVEAKAHGGSDQVLRSAIATGQALGLSNSQIAEQVKTIGHQKGYSDEEIGKSLASLPGAGENEPGRADTLAQAPIVVTTPAVAQPAPVPAPPPVALPSKGPPPSLAPPTATAGTVSLSPSTRAGDGVARPVDAKGSTQAQQDFEIKTSPTTVVGQVSVSVYDSPDNSYDEVTITISDEHGNNGEQIKGVKVEEIISDGKIDPVKVKLKVDQHKNGAGW